MVKKIKRGHFDRGLDISDQDSDALFFLNFSMAIFWSIVKA